MENYRERMSGAVAPAAPPATPASTGSSSEDFNPPDHDTAYLLNLAADNRFLTLEELNKVIRYLNDRRDRLAAKQGVVAKPAGNMFSRMIFFLIYDFMPFWIDLQKYLRIFMRFYDSQIGTNTLVFSGTQSNAEFVFGAWHISFTLRKEVAFSRLILQVQHTNLCSVRYLLFL